VRTIRPEHDDAVVGGPLEEAAQVVAYASSVLPL
jgi:hypothetical protein